jgi:hypothetical protein
MRGTLVRPTSITNLRLSAGQQVIAGRVAAAATMLAVLVALASIVVYIWTALHRISYPYELDWLEGGAVEIVGRVLAGKPLYTTPSLAYVSYTYPPLYSYVSAAVAEVTGNGFLPLRLVSFVSSLAAIGVLWRWVVDATKDHVAGPVAAGLFAATYGLTGWSFDVGRLDSLFLALTLTALWLGRRAEGVGGGIAVGAIAFLAVFTKQIALVALVPAFVWLALIRPRAGLAALATLFLLVAGSTVLLDDLTNGWYRYFVLNELSGQPWLRWMWVGFWSVDLYYYLWPLAWLVAVTAIIVGARAWRRRSYHDRPRLRLAMWRGADGHLGVGYEVASIAGLLLAAWFSRLHSGSAPNVLMPAYAACALLATLSFSWLHRLGPLPAFAASAVVLVQVAMLLSMPNHAIPTRAERTAGTELISRLRSLPGPVLVLAHPWYGSLAGKGSFAQVDAIIEVLRSDASRGAAVLNRTLGDSLNHYHIQAVVLDQLASGWIAGQLARDFVLQPGTITQQLLRPPAGRRSAPTYLYLRRSQPR